MYRYLLCATAALMVLATFARADEPSSPCVDRFTYNVFEEQPEKGTWTGTLKLNSEFKLHGIWLRLFFDRPVKSVTSPDGMVDVHPSDNDAKSFLLKNRDYVLQKNELTPVEFTVAYEGTKIPALIGYRVNARNVCPGDDD